jgi:chloramphenicol-sensitive protein RarD
MNEAGSAAPPSGLPAAIGGYLIWGLLPLYLILVNAVPAVEFVGWRIIWTVPICLAIAGARGQLGELRRVLGDIRLLAWLAASASLIGVNWLIYIWAIQSGNIYAASLGYYINPLVNVLLGTVLLKERLSRAQWLAVAIAGLGIAVLLGGALTTLWISLSLALSFGTYGLIRKQVDVGSLPGLTVESIILLLPAAGIAAWFAATPDGSSFGHELGLSLAIVLGGLATAVPLWLFAIAARRMAYSTLGFIQFLAPTIVFVLGLTVFGRPLQPVQLISFALIWAAIAVFVWDMWTRRNAPRPVAS